MADEILPEFSRFNTPTFAELAAARQGDGFAHLGTELGSVLFGGPAREARGQQIQQQAATGAARMEDILMQARQRRDAEIGRRAAAKMYADKGDNEAANIVLNSDSADQAQQALLRRNQLQSLNGVSGALSGIGYSPEQASLGGVMFGAAGGTNPQNTIEALQRASLGVAGTSAAQASVPQPAQTLAHALVPDSTRINDGYVFDTTAPTTQALQATPIAQARRSEIGALMNEHAAQANAANALADKRRSAPATGTDDNGNAVATDSTPLTGADYLNALPPNRRSLVELLVSGKQAPPTGYALRSPEVQQILADAHRADPSYDANRFAVRKEFESGGNASPANVITAGTTALQHLGQLMDKARALGTIGNAGVANMPANMVRNAYLNLKQDPRVAGFNAVRDKFVEEATRFYRGIGGAEADIKREIDALNAAQSPQQLQEVIQTQAHLMASKVNALQDRWRKTMGIAAGDFPVLSDANTQRAVQNIDAGIGRRTAMPPNGTSKVIGGKTYTVVDGHWDDGQ